MAWVDPTNVATGDVLTASKWNQDVVANWQAVGGAWTAYTPTWTNLTVGNATQDSRYIKVGRLVMVNLKIILGSTSSVGSIPEFSLPANLDASYGTGDTIGDLQLQQVSAGAVYWGKALPRTDLTGARPFVDQVAGTYNVPQIVNATIPFTWATGDIISGTLIYEAA